MTPEDIGDIFQELEDALFAMAIRNMDAHQNWEKDEGFKWTQWQAEQIKGLREYREKVNIMTNKGFDEANEAVKEFLQEAYDGSVDDAAGLAVKAGKGDVRPAFFGVNSDKMNIILDEAVKDIDTKRYACINRMNSGYTDFLRKADIFAQSGSMTIPQALDYAMKDFLAAGLNCVEYSNGNRVNIASYAEMALRTSSSEVTRQANGDVRNALGEHLVVSNVIGMTCPYCYKWQGRVLIDDVYSDGKPDGKHPLVSTAKNDHFLHPNCRHQLFMYIEGITEVADLPDEEETKEKYQAEQKQRYQERQIRKYKRLRDGAVDPADRKKYDARVKEWTEKHDKYLREHPYLRKNPKRLVPKGDISPSQHMSGNADSDYKISGKASDDPRVIGSNTHLKEDFVPPENVDPLMYDYENNCTNCVVAYDSRCKGMDVTAKSVGEYNDIEINMFWAWKGRRPKVNVYDFNEILDYCNNCENSTRIAVSAFRTPDEFGKLRHGHAFVVEKRNGRTIIVDPQVAREYTTIEEIEDYLQGQSFSGRYEYMKIDDLELTEEGTLACKKV